MLSKATVKARPSVLWCYKKDLYLSSHRKKRVNQVKKLVARGLLDPEKEDPFSLFVASTSIRYCYYSETHTVLGQTFGMCVLQVWRLRPARPKTLHVPRRWQASLTRPLTPAPRRTSRRSRPTCWRAPWRRWRAAASWCSSSPASTR
jgi:hypothetical protein